LYLVRFLDFGVANQWVRDGGREGDMELERERGE